MNREKLVVGAKMLLNIMEGIPSKTVASPLVFSDFYLYFGPPTNVILSFMK